jgi:hypothetical protein
VAKVVALVAFNYWHPNTCSSSSHFTFANSGTYPDSRNAESAGEDRERTVLQDRSSHSYLLFSLVDWMPTVHFPGVYTLTSKMEGREGESSRRMKADNVEALAKQLYRTSGHPANVKPRRVTYLGVSL